MLGKLGSYLKESKDEMKKVVWPSRKQTIRYTMMVIGVCVVMAIFLGTIDYIFTTILDKVI